MSKNKKEAASQSDIAGIKDEGGVGQESTVSGPGATTEAIADEAQHANKAGADVGATVEENGETSPETAAADESLPTEPAADLSREGEPEGTVDGEPSLSAQLEEAMATAEKNRNAYLRALADMQNLRKRSERENEQSRRFAIEGFARDLLPVADNLERALSAIPEDSGPELKALEDGVKMIQNELTRALEKHGVTRIEALNLPFDPNLHQAVVQMDAPALEPGMVAQVMQSGYLLNNRLLRPSMVGVAKEE